MKNIIFDLGAVIIDINYNFTAEAFKKIGVTNFDEIYSKKKQDHFFDDFETGHLTNDQFRSEIRKHITHKISDEQIDDAWNAMLINIPVSRMKWLKSLRPKYRIFLLSNTNRIHVKAFSKIISDTHGVGTFESCFDKIYLSCNVGLRKPNAEIFDLVVKENNLDLAETVFIDDSPQHIEGAKKYGLTAWHLKDQEKVEEVFSKVINI
ncbi:MAG: HAD family phosphatase [Bacteroidetes bacterium]|nr:HAD family phosphatase [Bacteroidota bacterium]